MLIRTQDKRALVNFKNVYSIFIQTPDGSFELDESSGDLKPLKNTYTLYSENNEDNWKWLGQYSTIGQAKDILDEIETFSTDKMANRLIYPMPSDEGMIWEERHGKIDA